MMKLPKKNGLTLLELICVMAILSSVITVSAPSLFRFFRGRSLTEESRRFLSLTRYARSEAISSSVPVELWLDRESGSYGLRRMATYGDEEEYVREYQLDENLEFELDESFVNKKGMALLVFYPDGFMDSENPEKIAITKNDVEKIVITKTDSGLEYVIE